MKHTDALVSPQIFETQGYCVEEGFLTPDDCDHLLGRIAQYRAAHEVPEVYRKVRGRSLHYFVIDGHQVEQHLPAIWKLYEQVNDEIMQRPPRTLPCVVQSICEGPRASVFSDEQHAAR